MTLSFTLVRSANIAAKKTKNRATTKKEKKIAKNDCSSIEELIITMLKHVLTD
jgi:hypothetical protein